MSAEPTRSRPGHEDSDARPQFMGLIAGALSSLVAVGLLVGWAFAAAGKGGAPMLRISSTFQHGPEARTEVDRAWADYERETRAHLAGYGWVDRQAGIVKIPIDRAIDILCSEQARTSSVPVESGSAP